ncbi:hypothetical protein HDV01_002167 [Terramyces sp. JEL0728]|nr:hypothetical protein HDV01_002167 [Terramyces sp. JEL0728]
MKKFTKLRYLLIQAVLIYGLYIYIFSVPTYPNNLLYPTEDQSLNNSCGKDPAADQFRLARMDSATYYSDMIAECAAISRQDQSNCNVPKIVHLIPGSSFKYYHYIAVKAVVDIIKPYKIYMHGEIFPVNNKLFMKTIRDYDIELVMSRTVNKVFGNEMFHGEHKSDILRLEALIRHGGIYLDMDAFVVKPFDRFMKDELSIGYQNKDEDYGINNGIMVAKKCSSSEWDELSIRTPLRLYNLDSSHTKVYEQELLSWYSFDGNPYEMPMFRPYNNEDWKQTYAVHSFYRLFKENIPTEYDFETVKQLQSSFGQYARHILYDGPPL